jgi:hypothetical protein
VREPKRQLSTPWLPIPVMNATPAVNLRALRSLVAVVVPLLASACGGGSSAPGEKTIGPVWEPGEWTIREAFVRNGNSQARFYQAGDSVSFEMDHIVAERRGASRYELTREAIEARLGFPLDDYSNAADDGPPGVTLCFTADRRAEPEALRVSYRLRIYPGDWGMPPVVDEEGLLERPGQADEAWQAAYLVARR